jgi:hypothetical protein
VLDGEPTLRRAQDTTDQVRAALDEQFAIANVTLESECGGAAVRRCGGAAVSKGASRVTRTDFDESAEPLRRDG